MRWQAILAIFLGLVPFLMLPTVIAFVGRKRSRFQILLVNVLFLLFAVPGISLFGAPTLGALGSVIVWLVVFGWSLRKDLVSSETIDEAVTLTTYDPHWPAAFELERGRIANAADIPAASIEHIGSTAVPGMLAKPIVDVMIGVDAYPPLDPLISRLVILGYEDLGEAGVPGRRYLRLREGTAFNVHVVQRGGEHWANNLRVRELLRRDAAARETYGAAKRAALEVSGRLLGYSRAKEPALAKLVADSAVVKQA